MIYAAGFRAGVIRNARNPYTPGTTEHSKWGAGNKAGKKARARRDANDH